MRTYINRQFNKLCCNETDLFFVHFNACNLCFQKKYKIRDCHLNLKHSFDIAYNETRLNNNIMHLFHIPGYNVFFTNTTKTRAGGVALFIKDTLKRHMFLIEIKFKIY